MSELGVRRTPRTRAGWVETQAGEWVRASAIVAVTPSAAVDWPSAPEGNPDHWLITRVVAGGQEWGSVYPVDALLDAIAAADRRVALQEVAP